jgi:DNA-binding winged helix-turn-helix (wHTH) protein
VPEPLRLVARNIELDEGRQELRRNGVVIKLEPHPLELLVLLMKRSDQVVTREEIARHLWRDGTFVETDQGINTAVGKLRKALGEAAREPRHICTVSGKGYRFIGPVLALPPTEHVALSSLCRISWTGRTVALTPGEHLIGRDAGAAVCLDAVAVSRRHAVIRITDEAALLEDLGSKNGTLINGRKITCPMRLESGDEIEVGGTRLVFLRTAHADPTATLPSPDL